LIVLLSMSEGKVIKLPDAPIPPSLASAESTSDNGSFTNCTSAQNTTFHSHLAKAGHLTDDLKARNTEQSQIPLGLQPPENAQPTRDVLLKNSLTEDELGFLRKELKGGYGFVILGDCLLLGLQFLLIGPTLVWLATGEEFGISALVLMSQLAFFAATGGYVGFYLSSWIKESSPIKCSIICALPIIGPIKIMKYHGKAKRILSENELNKPN
jgi:hypothetical protein